MMLFSEVYGKYYRAVAAILCEAIQGDLDDARLIEITRDHAFAESSLKIPAALKDGSWPLLDGEYRTPLKNEPSMPLSLLEKRWMKALLSDPRICLFEPPIEGLEDVEPLFDHGVFVYYDRYSDGDPYSDAGYIKHFRTVLAALREKRIIAIEFLSHRDRKYRGECVPYKLEYSSKDDKFRLIAKSQRGRVMAVNIARIIDCELLETCRTDAANNEYEYAPPVSRKSSLTLELVDERNALERAMLHFSHLERETERLDEDRYRIVLCYDPEDETEILIRILSFGPKLRVVAPDAFIAKVRERIERQYNLAAFFP